MEIFIQKEDYPHLIAVLDQEGFDEISILRKQETTDTDIYCVTLNNCEPSDIFLIGKWIGIQSAKSIVNNVKA